MIIRKLYKIESAHIVKNAYSKRCSQNYHGHSGKIEVFLKCLELDNAGMVIDFGKLKNEIGSFVDMFDHSIHLYKDDENKDFFITNNERYLILPCNPTAENYAILFRDCIEQLLEDLDYTNGEGFVQCIGVRYHETDTGYAESTFDDRQRFRLEDIKYSQQTINEASEQLKTIFRRRKICE